MPMTAWNLFLIGLGLAGGVLAVGVALLLLFVLYLAVLGTSRRA